MTKHKLRRDSPNKKKSQEKSDSESSTSKKYAESFLDIDRVSATFSLLYSYTYRIKCIMYICVDLLTFIYHRLLLSVLTQRYEDTNHLGKVAPMKLDRAKAAAKKNTVYLYIKLMSKYFITLFRLLVRSWYTLGWIDERWKESNTFILAKSFKLHENQIKTNLM